MYVITVPLGLKLIYVSKSKFSMWTHGFEGDENMSLNIYGVLPRCEAIKLSLQH